MKSTLPRETIRLIYLIGLLGFIFTLLFYVNNLLMSMVLAFVVYYLLSPIISYCERRGLNRSLAIFIIYTLNSILVISLFYIFIPLIVDQLGLLEKELPELQSGFLSLVDRAENRLQSIFHLEEPLFREKLRLWVIDQTAEYSSAAIRSATDSFTIFFLTPFLAFFMLRDGSTMKKRALDFIPNKYFEIVLKLIYDMNDQVGSFIRARLAEAFIVGLVTWVGLLLIDFPYATLLALFAAITNLIPYVGPVIGAVPALIIIFVNPTFLFGSVSMNILVVSIVYLTAHILDAVFIIPVVVAKIVNLHPVTVVLVIIVGAQWLGVLGMIISIPLASLLKLLVSTFYRHSIGVRQDPF